MGSKQTIWQCFGASSCPVAVAKLSIFLCIFPFISIFYSITYICYIYFLLRPLCSSVGTDPRLSWAMPQAPCPTFYIRAFSILDLNLFAYLFLYMYFVIIISSLLFLPFFSAHKCLVNLGRFTALIGSFFPHQLSLQI